MTTTSALLWELENVCQSSWCLENVAQRMAITTPYVAILSHFKIRDFLNYKNMQFILTVKSIK